MKLRLILGDQLNLNHSWFQNREEDILYLMMELKQETAYVNHHIQKVVAFFLSMRRFSQNLIKNGHKLLYLTSDDETNQQDLKDNINQVIKDYGITKFEYQLPDEYRLDEQLKSLCENLNIDHESYDSEHFYTSRHEMKDFFENKKSKQWLMESFYRMMRKKENLLMDGNQPQGSKWNFDHSNRKKIPKNHKVTAPLLFDQDVTELVQLLKDENVITIGKIDDKHFLWPTSREESLELLKFFCEHCLPLFGDFQDSMEQNEWSVYHSRLSFSMNTKMLSPKEVIEAVLTHWTKNKDQIDISQVEGFVRQIIGWREYMRGIYWAKMPDYYEHNKLNHHRKLPDFFWNGNTKMNCLNQSINQSLDYAYAHHIQRLMVTGNFALLAGIEPKEVDQWYLGIYIDAIEWVELPNTRGMSQYADGGIIATKPYVSSANYINKMGNYCQNCHYQQSKKTGDGACPFNSLFWNFIDQHLDQWKSNQRMSMMVRNWEKQNPQSKQALLDQAKSYLEEIENL